jgi:hypothetical protein
LCAVLIVFWLQVGDLEKFADKFNVRVERAIRRIKVGQPATTALKKLNQHEIGLIVECVQQSATIESCLTMGLAVKDVRQLFPVSIPAFACASEMTKGC